MLTNTFRYRNVCPLQSYKFATQFLDIFLWLCGPAVRLSNLIERVCIVCGLDVTDEIQTRFTTMVVRIRFRGRNSTRLRKQSRQAIAPMSLFQVALNYVQSSDARSSMIKILVADDEPPQSRSQSYMYAKQRAVNICP